MRSERCSVGAKIFARPSPRLAFHPAQALGGEATFLEPRVVCNPVAFDQCSVRLARGFHLEREHCRDSIHARASEHLHHLLDVLSEELDPCWHERVDPQPTPQPAVRKGAGGKCRLEHVAACVATGGLALELVLRLIVESQETQVCVAELADLEQGTLSGFGDMC